MYITWSYWLRNMNTFVLIESCEKERSNWSKVRCVKVKESHERVKTRMQEIAIMKNMLEKMLDIRENAKKNWPPESTTTNWNASKKPYSLDERSEYEIVRNKKNRSTLNNIHAPRANIEEVNWSMPTEFTEDSEHGPLSVLVSAIKTNSQVLINCRNNRKLLGRVKAFERHLNLLLENGVNRWTG